MFYGNSYEQWLIAVAIAAGSVLVSRLFYFISTKGIKRIFDREKTRFMHITIDMLEEPLAMLIVIFGIYYAQRRLVFPEGVDAKVDQAATFVVILVITWALARLLNDLISEFLVPIIEKSDSKLDDQLLPFLRKGATALIWTLGVIIALDNVGYNVQTIIAGLGIGGLAFAFAAQETIANFFGGVTVFVDAPFVIGDRIKIAGYDGWVREMGIRTAKLETLDGRRLTMPNSFFSKNVIENVTSEPATRFIQTIGLSCDQSSAKIERAMELIKQMEIGHEGLEDRSTAWFSGVGTSSWDLTVVYWIKKGADYAGTISTANVALVRALETEGIQFSLPMNVIIKAKE